MQPWAYIVIILGALIGGGLLIWLVSILIGHIKRINMDEQNKTEWSKWVKKYEKYNTEELEKMLRLWIVDPRTREADAIKAVIKERLDKKVDFSPLVDTNRKIAKAQTKAFTKILIFSDAHLHTNAFKQSFNKKSVERIITFCKPDVIINAGDMEEWEYNTELIKRYGDNYHWILGNWEDDDTYIEEYSKEEYLVNKFSIRNWKFVLTHGDHVCLSKEKWPQYSGLWKYVKEKDEFVPNEHKVKNFNCDILILGHIHKQLHFLYNRKPIVIESGSVNHYRHGEYERYPDKMFLSNVSTTNNQKVSGAKFGSFDILYLYDTKAMLKEYSIITHCNMSEHVKEHFKIDVTQNNVDGKDHIVWDDKVYWFKKP